MTRIATIVGARPQFIKAAPVTLELRAAGLEEILVHTGQHYDATMSDVFFEELGIPAPHYHLGIGSAPHGSQTARMLEAIEGVLQKERPDRALVYGDTNSTLAGALAAAKVGIPVAHVEAGLRSFDRRMPEEVNRVLADRIASTLFAPTEVAGENLAREGVPAEWVHRVGDVMYDACLLFGDRADATSDVLARLELERADFALATIHRAANTDDPRTLGIVLDGLALLSRALPVVFPAHPRTRQAMQREDLESRLRGSRVRIVEPVSYLDVTVLQRAARVVVTDSGGMQKEAFFHRTPCVTLRDTTEWTELVELGWNALVPPDDPVTIRDAALRAAEGAGGSEAPADVYGAGDAARRIARILASE